MLLKADGGIVRLTGDGSRVVPASQARARVPNQHRVVNVAVSAESSPVLAEVAESSRHC